ncbi:MAG: phosphatidylserine decarboxylase [Parachlamydiaceae bacterium]|nr:phosphatidylserine decarboxylase [Parachlamydiaceae bacterium]
MKDIIYINRKTGQKELEKVYGKGALKLFYGNYFFSNTFRAKLLPLIVKFPFFSALYGFLQKNPLSRKKIVPFIQEYGVDPSEFLEPISSFRTFNDFFIRKLKPDARPIVPGEKIAVMPADARYYFFQNIDKNDGFVVKGERLNLVELLEDELLAERYMGGSIVLARLCPSDYHRFHFPCECIPGQTRFINGWLYSVNPVAIKKDIAIFTKNKRTVCELETKEFGKVLYLEIGATNVGSIHETYTPFTPQQKGAEKGYFEFGASSLILLFQKDSIQFDSDLIAATESGCEIRCLMGQQMGIAKSN